MVEIPVIDLEGLHGGDLQSDTMALLHQACESWGFFQVSNHGISAELMAKVKRLVNLHYEESMKRNFYESDMAKGLESEGVPAADKDWESSFFIWHKPKSNINESNNLSGDLQVDLTHGALYRQVMDEYITQLIKVTERLAELICVNLRLEKDYLKKAFSGAEGPSVGTKVAKYPQCARPELVTGLRAHTDAGGIILLLQDDQVPGLEFVKDGKWVEIPPSTNNTIFVNTGDQLEVLSNGRYKSTVHRVMADKNGSRLSIATFYNPVGHAIISPAQELLYPKNYSFKDYLEQYATTKFSDKVSRFESMNMKASGHQNLPA